MAQPATKIETGIKTVGDWLLDNFGESSLRIVGFEVWRRETISGASFVTDDDGGLFVLCGGQAIIAFHRKHTVDKKPLYLVIDGSAGAVAELRRIAGMTGITHGNGKRDTLKLVYSA